jgi:L-asparagine permease
MPLAPYSGYLTLAFLAGVLVLMVFDAERGPWIIATLVIGLPALIGGWYLVRNRVTATAEEVIDHTGDIPVAADVPVAGDVPVVADQAEDADDSPPAPGNPGGGITQSS